MKDKKADDLVTRSFEFKKFRRMGNKVDTWALSSQSTISAEIYARIITHGKKGFEALVTRVEHRDFRDLDLFWLARFARIVILQPSNARLQKFARIALGHCAPRLPATRATFVLRKLLVEVLILDGNLKQARLLLDADDDVREEYYGYLNADAYNPFESGSLIDYFRWEKMFNAPFAAHSMIDVTVDKNSATPFNSMNTEASVSIDGGELVTVILTTFNPDPDEIRVSARSILRQTWSNLELIIVDDHSDQASANVLGDLKREDPRVRLIRLPVNGGTYRARNAGLAEARGVYVTGQDTDDWSHPERLARQVRAFSEHPEAPAVMTTANRMNDSLVRAAPGLNPYRRCEVSLMVRREKALEIGGYLPARKGADSEFRERLEAWEGGQTHRMPEPLYLIRLSANSLSRSDFRVGWAAPHRRNFSSAYRHWHRTARTSDLAIGALTSNQPLPFTLPPQISGVPPREETTQLAFLCDWRANSSIQRAALDEVNTALEAGISVALIHLDSPHAPALSPSAMIPPVQELINSGRVSLVTSQDYADIGILIIRDPSCVDYARTHAPTLSVGRTILVADDSMNGSPMELWNYDPRHAQQMAHTLFGVEPTWAMLNSTNALSFSEGFGVPTNGLQYPLVIRHVSEHRRPFSPSRPIIGKTAINVQSEWPSAESLSVVYPTDGSIDVRVLGDARGGVRELRQKYVPPAWRSFRHGEIDAHVFWRSVEFAVSYDRRGTSQSVTRDVLEAMAASCLVIQKPAAKEVYADAIEIAEHYAVPEKIRALRENPERYRERIANAHEFLRDCCSPARYVQFLKEVGI